MEKILELNFGELLLHSMDKDGTGMNFDYEIMKHLPKNNKKPLIFSGGAGNYHHLKEGLAHKDIDAVSTANLLNFVGVGLIYDRKILLDEARKSEEDFSEEPCVRLQYLIQYVWGIKINKFL